MLAQFMDYGINRFAGTATGNTKTHRNSISIPRFVLAFDYKFNQKWILGAEIEFEAGGVGSAVEIENSENGEYETEIEKGGEVALEQFHITRLIVPQFNVRAGHLIVPVGLTNAHHEPINFFGPSRPQAETSLLPSTWHETGIELFGSFGRRFTRFDYQLMVVAGLNANGFDRNEWIIGGKAGYFETDNFTSPGYVARVDYSGVPGLRTGVSFYYCRDAGSNSDKEQTYASIGRIPVAIGTWDAQYRNRYVTARANLTYGYVGNSAALSEINRRLSNNSPYSRLIPIAKNALSYGGRGRTQPRLGHRQRLPHNLSLRKIRILQPAMPRRRQATDGQAPGSKPVASGPQLVRPAESGSEGFVHQPPDRNGESLRQGSLQFRERICHRHRLRRMVHPKVNLELEIRN